MAARSLVALGALNFFMADVRDGLGPFLGVYLQAHDWSPAAIGTVMTIGGLADHGGDDSRRHSGGQHACQTRRDGDCGACRDGGFACVARDAQLSCSPQRPRW